MSEELDPSVTGQGPWNREKDGKCVEAGHVVSGNYPGLYTM